MLLLLPGPVLVVACPAGAAAVVSAVSGLLLLPAQLLLLGL